MNSIASVVAYGAEWASTHGGLSTVNRELCSSLAARGLTVSCVVVAATPAERADAAARGVTLIEVPTDAQPPELALARRPVLPPGVMPELIIGHGRVTGPAALSVARDHFPQAKLAHVIHTAPDEIEWLKTGRIGDAGHRAESRTQLEVALARAADRVYAVGPQLHLRYLNELHGFGVVPDRIDPGFDLTEQRMATPPPGAPVRVLVAGRAEDAMVKGLDLAARAMGIVARKQRDHLPVELYVRGAPAGSAEALRNRLQRWARNPALHIVVRPYSTDREQLSGELLAASLVLMPSRFEGFGLTGVDAVSAGIPLISSSRSGLALLLRELLPEGEADRHIVAMSGDDELDAQRWARAIGAKLEDRPAAFAQAGSLRTFMAGRRTWSGAVDHLLRGLGVDIALWTTSAGTPRGASGLVPGDRPGTQPFSSCVAVGFDVVENEDGLDDRGGSAWAAAQLGEDLPGLEGSDCSFSAGADLRVGAVDGLLPA